MDYKLKYVLKNIPAKIWHRIRHPWPLYKKVGSIEATITREDGTVITLGNIATAYKRRGSSTQIR